MRVTLILQRYFQAVIGRSRHTPHHFRRGFALLWFHEHWQTDAQRDLQSSKARRWRRWQFLQENPVCQLVCRIRLPSQSRANNLFAVRRNGDDRW
ncbi:MAG: hypothetical protein Q8L40_03385, partial [Burkholderiales bacterium]|nr:hypothetical protein [Burkholderiales bacterium]